MVHGEGLWSWSRETGFCTIRAASGWVNVRGAGLQQPGEPRWLQEVLGQEFLFCTTWSCMFVDAGLHRSVFRTRHSTRNFLWPEPSFWCAKNQFAAWRTAQWWANAGVAGALRHLQFATVNSQPLSTSTTGQAWDAAGGGRRQIGRRFRACHTAAGGIRI